MRNISFVMPELPTDDEMRIRANLWWSEIGPVSLDAWPNTLWHEGINAIRVPLSLDIVNAIIEGPTPTESLADMLTNALRAHGQLMVGGDTAEWAYNQWVEGLGVFPRLSSRSPKDYLVGPDGLMAPCRTMLDVARALEGSMRVFDDLALMRFLDNRNLYLRAFAPIDPASEWRMFIRDGEIKAVAQYDYSKPLLSKRVSIQYFSRVMQAAKYYAKLVLRYLATKNLVVDFVVRGDMRTTLLETNPFGLSDPCAAHDYETIVESECELWFMDQYMKPISIKL